MSKAIGVAGPAEVVGEPRDEERLHLVADERDAGPLDQVAKGVRRLRTLRRDDATVRADHRQRERRATTGSRIVGDQRRAEDGLRGDPVGELRDPVGPADLDAAGIHDRGGEGRREIAVGFRCRRRVAVPAVRRRGHRGRAVRGRGSGDRVEVQAQLQFAALARRPAGGGPAVRPPGHAGRRHVATLRNGPERLRALLR